MDQDDRLAGRNGDIWRAYISGRNQEWIAQRYGLTQQRVSQILAEVRDHLPPDTKHTWQIIAIETLAAIHAEMVDIVNASLPPLFQAGAILRDENDEVVRDVSARLAAVNTLLRVQKRAAEQLGLDEPARTRVEVITEDVIDAEIRRLEHELENRGISGETASPP